jgi:alkylation response protein AidB-like acyl-CoA dehydrogenase
MAETTEGSGVEAAVDPEELEAYRLRARTWLAETMPRLPEGKDNWQLAQEDEMAVRARELQRLLFDGGYAGICYPKEYGGQGLTRAHQRAFTQESMGYQMPTTFNVPTLTILAPTVLDFGTEEQKKRHIPAILKGEELWVQFLSEPSGGSDLAGLVTTATRDGDVFALNGSKIWSSGAFRADYCLCLARTDSSVPKHQGLTMFILKIHQPGIEVQRIKMINGTAEFCQEYFDDVLIPASDALGGINDGWTVASRLLYHERDAVGGGSPYSSGLGMGNAAKGGQRSDLEDLARATGQTHDPVVRQMLAEARVNDRVQSQLIERVAQGIRSGAMPGPAGSLTRLYAATNGERRCDIGLEIAANAGGAWVEGDPAGPWAVNYLSRQGYSLGGGSNEMQRNIISERVLGMPREFAADRDQPFDQVRHNRSPKRSAS